MEKSIDLNRLLIIFTKCDCAHNQYWTGNDRYSSTNWHGNFLVKRCKNIRQ